MNTSLGMGRIPSIFVSSTCYDLSQVRTDLKLFIEQLGYDPILSEYNSFPINPNLGTIENCLRVVQERADILVLIVGGRYGSQTDFGKSITNLEYIRAKTKGIPVYVFVSKSILAMLNFWRDNPEGNFSSVVDSVKLFEFVQTLRGIDNVWVYGFDNVQEINDTLRKQLAYLFYDALCFRKQLETSRLSHNLLRLKGEAFRLVVEKPIAWEYRLFGQVFEDGLKEAHDIRNDLKYGILFGKGRTLYDANEIIDWLGVKINDLLRISTSLDALFNRALVDAVGAPGEPGDADHIVYVAEKVVEAYKNVIQWAIDYKSIDVEQEWDELVIKTSNICETIISDLENYCERYQREIKNALTLLKESNDPIVLDLTFILQAPNVDEFYDELNHIRIKHGIAD